MSEPRFEKMPASGSWLHSDEYQLVPNDAMVAELGKLSATLNRFNEALFEPEPSAILIPTAWVPGHPVTLLGIKCRAVDWVDQMMVCYPTGHVADLRGRGTA